MAGKILDTSVLMDNWFCCEQATKKVEGMENADMFKLRPGTITPGM